MIVERGDKPDRDPLTEKIIGAAIEVHRTLGPGLLESAYEECLCRELETSGLAFLRQVMLPVHDAQVLTDLKLGGIGKGLLMNFNATPLKNGIKRFVV